MSLIRKSLVAAWIGFGVLTLLAGCQTGPQVPRGKPASADEAKRAITKGEFVRAAQEYDRLADEADPPNKQHYQLQAVRLYLKAAQISEARKKMGLIKVNDLDPSYRARKRILEGQLAAAEGDNARAIILLNAAKRVRNLDPAVHADILWIRAQAKIALNKHFSAAHDLIRRERYLVDKETLQENQLQLWKILTSLTKTELRTKRHKASNPVMRGWLDLAIISIERGGRPRALKRSAKLWKQQYPTHPIVPKLLATIASAKPTLIGRIDNIAVLLPLTSRHGRAAQAVRDGFMAMDRTNTNPDKPRVIIYDIGDNPGEASDYYERAVREGAQLIIGPLGLDAAKNVVRQTNLSVPTLLLSHIKDDVGADNIYQFGLPPEQEARQAAERAYLDGHRQAALLFPDTKWGQRMRLAFTDHWQRLGGILIKEQGYDVKAGDYSEPIKELLNITQSLQRKQALQTRLNLKINFEPRARADIDFIFLAADARSGRLIKPQLNYHQAAHIPVYATSHIFQGKADAARDADLNGVIFGDMPWLLLGSRRMQHLRATLQQQWSYAFSPFDRLFALGVDSYAIIPHLGRITSQESVRFNGVTSGLSVDPSGRLHRQLLWARFRRGVPRILDTFVKYKEHLDINNGRDTTRTPEARSKS